MRIGTRQDWLWHVVPFVFAFGLSIAFDPWTYSGATTTRWALLATFIPLFLLFQSRNNLKLSHLIGLVLIAWAAISLTWTANVYDGIGELIQIGVIGGTFLYGSRLKDLQTIFQGLAIGIAVSSLILLFHPAIVSIVQTYPHGLFGNRNMLAEAAVLTALGCLVYQNYWMLVGLIPAVFWLPISRGALLALAAGFCVWMWSINRKIAYALFILAIVAGLVSINGLQDRAWTVFQRFDVWEAVASNLTLFGHGIGSLFTLAPYFTPFIDTSIVRLDHAHNEALEVAFELGLPGLVLYAAIVINALGCSFKDSPLGNPAPVLVGFLVISSVAFPWHIPTNAFIGALVLGHSVRNRADLRDIYNTCRSLLCEGDEFEQRAVARVSDAEFAQGGKSKSI